MAEKKTTTKKAAEKKAPAKKATKKVAVAEAAVVEAPVAVAEAPKAEKKAPAKKACAKKTATKAAASTALYINAESVGFRAGDVYQALNASEKAMTVAEIAKAANITVEEVLLGAGWLFKEGKLVGENIADLRLA